MLVHVMIVIAVRVNDIFVIRLIFMNQLYADLIIVILIIVIV